MTNQTKPVAILNEDQEKLTKLTEQFSALAEEAAQLNGCFVSFTIAQVIDENARVGGGYGGDLATATSKLLPPLTSLSFQSDLATEMLGQGKSVSLQFSVDDEIATSVNIDAQSWAMQGRVSDCVVAGVMPFAPEEYGNAMKTIGAAAVREQLETALKNAA